MNTTSAVTLARRVIHWKPDYRHGSFAHRPFLPDGNTRPVQSPYPNPWVHAHNFDFGGGSYSSLSSFGRLCTGDKLNPPSDVMVTPERFVPAGEASKSAAPAMSRGPPSRPLGAERESGSVGFLEGSEPAGSIPAPAVMSVFGKR